MEITENPKNPQEKDFSYWKEQFTQANASATLKESDQDYYLDKLEITAKNPEDWEFIFQNSTGQRCLEARKKMATFV